MESARHDEPVAVPDARLVSRACELPDVSFRAFLARAETPRVGWAAPDGLELAGAGAAARLTASGPSRFDDLREGADAAFADVDHDGPVATRPRMVGGVAFVPDHEPAPPWTGFPAAEFILPARQLTRTDDGTWLTVTSFGPTADPDAVTRDLEATHETVAELPAMRPSGGPPGVAATRRVPGQAEWIRQVEDAVDRIRGTELRKVVLATALEVDLAGALDVPDALERLRRTYPNCYRFLLQPSEDAAFFGPPPERLVRLDGRHVETEALAGSMPRGDSPELDATYADELLESEKIRGEQGMVVDAIRDQLEPQGGVTVGDRGVRKLATIQHLGTPITADLDRDEHVLTLAEALHPTPAVGGLPPDEALGIIRSTESFDRGWYASPVGWFDAAGDGEFAVAIRSAVVTKDRATLFAGNGIVADSDPADEWEEIQPKFRPILDELEQ